MNQFKLWKNKIFRCYVRFITSLKDNRFLSIGFYGMLAMILIAILTPWLASNREAIYPDLALLIPAWDERGDINHILGIDQNGRDIFTNLLWSFQTSLVITFIISFYIIIIGSFISLVATFVKSVRNNIIVSFRMITTIPPLLMIIIIAIFSGNTLINLMIAIAISMLPQFIYNLDNMVTNELNKAYITALRLDGLCSFRIMWHCVVPNIWLNYIKECINVYIISLSSLTTLTFLNFGIESGKHELGIMMRDMIEIMPFNQWGFLAPGLIIMTIIILLNFLNFGLQQLFSRRD